MKCLKLLVFNKLYKPLKALLRSNQLLFSWYLREKNASNIYALIGVYNSAFGSLFEDGISPMADTIAINISEKGRSHTAKYFYGVFYDIIEAFMRDLKAVKITA